MRTRTKMANLRASSRSGPPGAGGSVAAGRRLGLSFRNLAIAVAVSIFLLLFSVSFLHTARTDSPDLSDLVSVFKHCLGSSSQEKRKRKVGFLACDFCSFRNVFFGLHLRKFLFFFLFPVDFNQFGSAGRARASNWIQIRDAFLLANTRV